jgi:hypothetical protein
MSYDGSPSRMACSFRCSSSAAVRRPSAPGSLRAAASRCSPIHVPELYVGQPIEQRGVDAVAVHQRRCASGNWSPTTAMIEHVCYYRLGQRWSYRTVLERVGVNQEDLTELHYITPIANLASIRMHGIFSHRLADEVDHQSIADPDVQARRARKRAPLPQPLHTYVNLYINARNPMMYRRQGQHRAICVLRVSPSVLQLTGVVIADQNAASDWARFHASPAGLAYIDKDMVFAEYWTRHEDVRDRWRHGGIMCAEVLLPNRLDPAHVLGAYVSCEESRSAVREVWPGLPVVVSPRLFFQR